MDITTLRIRVANALAHVAIAIDPLAHDDVPHRTSKPLAAQAKAALGDLEALANDIAADPNVPVWRSVLVAVLLNQAR